MVDNIEDGVHQRACVGPLQLCAAMLLRLSGGGDLNICQGRDARWMSHETLRMIARSNTTSFVRHRPREMFLGEGMRSRLEVSDRSRGRLSAGLRSRRRAQYPKFVRVFDCVGTSGRGLLSYNLATTGRCSAIGAALSGGPLMHSSLPLPAPSCSVLTFASPLQCCYQAVWGRRRLRWAATGVGVVPAGGPPRDHVTHRGRPRRLLLFLTVPPPPGGRLRLRAHRLAAIATLRGGFALPVASLVVPFPYPLSPLVAVDGARG